MSLNTRSVCCTAALALLSAPSFAQVSADCEELYQYFDITFQGIVVGQVLIVEQDSTSHPSGFSSGQEYWWWDTAVGPEWRGAFQLEPRGTSGYSYSSRAWETFPVDHFDLDNPTSMPPISPDGMDRFYQVSVLESGQLETQGYFWLMDGAPRQQIWYGVAGVLTEDLIGSGAPFIRFNAMFEPPAAGSLTVLPLCDGPC